MLNPSIQSLSTLHSSLSTLLLFCVAFAALYSPVSPGDTLRADPNVPFSDRTRAMGIDFLHQNGASAQKHLVETMGSGCALLDYDGDGRLDVLLINGGRTPDSPPFEPRPHALYRNLGGGRLEEVTPDAGLEPTADYGMGVAVGDYDNDGDPDLYLTYFGPNRLYRNNGDGTFSDVTGRAGVAGAEWSTSAAFFDYDRDGAADLYVVNYLDATFERNPPCEMKGVRAYCHPRHYAGVADRLYRNLGGGRFRDVSRSSGILNPEGKGLGVVAADFDQDGWVDLYVANDSVRNLLFRNNRDGTFADVTLLSGTGYNSQAQPEAGMGVDAADYDGDRLLDIVVTNYDLETNALYRYQGSWLFGDERWRSGLARKDRFLLGFGAAFLDFDNDGDRDLLVVNGHVVDNIERIQPDLSHPQPDQLFENRGGRFLEHEPFYRWSARQPRVGRGMALGDIDNDGDIDVLISNCGDEPALLLNRVGARRNWIQLRLTGTDSSRDAVGTRLTLTTAAGSQTDQVTGGGSYLSAGDPRAHFGLGEVDRVEEIRIRWPSGKEEVLTDIPANRILRVTEGRASEFLIAPGPRPVTE